MSESTLTMIEQAAAESTQTRLAEYHTAVAAVAEKKEMAPTDVVAVIEAAGKTFTDFERDVAARRDRLEKVAQLAKQPEHERTRKKLVAELAAANTKFEQVEKAHREAAEALITKINVLDRKLEACNSIRQSLAETCPDPARVAKWKRHLAKLRDVADARDEARALVRQKERTITNAQFAIKKAHDTSLDPRTQPNTRELENRIERVGDEIRRLKQTAEERQDELDQLERQTAILIDELSRL
ncbi:MAG: hypothetical protein ACOX1P_16505 [Thermoguttaceae bacterium]|jgi:hypothetical protein